MKADDIQVNDTVFCALHYPPRLEKKVQGIVLSSNKNEAGDTWFEVEFRITRIVHLDEVRSVKKPR